MSVLRDTVSIVEPDHATSVTLSRLLEWAEHVLWSMKLLWHWHWTISPQFSYQVSCLPQTNSLSTLVCQCPAVTGANAGGDVRPRWVVMQMQNKDTTLTDTNTTIVMTETATIWRREAWINQSAICHQTSTEPVSHTTLHTTTLLPIWWSNRLTGKPKQVEPQRILSI